MALSSARSFGRMIPTATRGFGNNVTNRTLRPRLLGHTRNTVLQQNLVANRSLWYFSKQMKNGPSCTCALHTPGDNELAEFLTSEIENEKRHLQTPTDDLRGFRVEKKQGAKVVLVKEAEGETIRIQTNINNSMDDDAEATGETESESKMVCRPPFTVELTKASSNKTLHIHCAFPHPDDVFEEEHQKPDDPQFIDALEIREVALLNKGEEWGDDTFAVAGSIMDGTFYDSLLSMLEERGIDGDFCDTFVSYMTDYEQNAYVNFLEECQKFVKSR